MTPFFASLRENVQRLGGLYNAHLHLDRAGTLDAARSLFSGKDGGDVAHLSLASKHQLIAAIHDSPAYDAGNLAARVAKYLVSLRCAGTTRANSFVDVTADRVGLTAMQQMLALRQDMAPGLELRLGAYSPLGFKDSEPERWAMLERGAEIADFIGSLPERDDRDDYPDYIGFREHCHRMLRLGKDLHKPVHIHVDQRNDPAECGTERVLEIVDECGLPDSDGDEPMLWLIHVISPSRYDESRFCRLLEKLATHNIGVVCCPSAALSMRQLRTIHAPCSNSIARVLEMLAAGIHVRIGSDNICDMASPAGTPDLMNEIFVLCNAIRYYDSGVLAKLAAGLRLTEPERSQVGQHLQQEAREIARVSDRYRHPQVE
jgi:cytosine/adenosine deaminase-related metal-dependent hydrolase